MRNDSSILPIGGGRAIVHARQCGYEAGCGRERGGAGRGARAHRSHVGYIYIYMKFIINQPSNLE